MIIIGIAFFVIGLLMLLFAWRGRIFAQGQFCRKCKFDLEGSPIDTQGNKCPECGQPIHTQSSRRITLRRSSRLGLTLAIVLMASGIAALWLGSSGKTSIFFGFLPDSTILWLSEQGVDEALDELAGRITSTTNPIPAEFHIRAIELALVHQADTSQPWNPRWGEVLSLSFGNPIMTDDQMKQYVRNGTNMSAQIRNRVRQGADAVDITVTSSPGRISAQNHNETGYWIQTQLVRSGVVGDKPRKFYGDDQSMHNFYIPKHGSSSSSPYRNTINPFGTGFDREPGSQVQVYVEYELVIRGLGLGVVGEYRTEQSILIIAQDEDVVSTFKDPELAQKFCDSIQISPVRILKNIPEPTSNFGIRALGIRLKFDGILASVAMQPFLRFDDGELIELNNNWTQQGPNPALKGSGAYLAATYYDAAMYERVAIITQRIIDQGHIDIVFKTDASLAEWKPGIDRVLDFTLVFENIPIEVYEEEDTIKFFPITKTLRELEWIEHGCTEDHTAGP
ncbi:MAG: hypothetical protein JKY43_07285 [Phycisphaerales bacterium]|nr:hypothetical protein [Phycisphaerales bacterium]